ncbi:glycoside hydrolase domain-containing protein [Neobacillus niacini]|uniref:DUF4091 domain-containing protein n=1 Tax=Neobacillus niacini TaxID=86668 RepID=UPI003B0113A1
MEVSHGFYTRVLSSLTKVFPDCELTDQPVITGTALGNETFSFQVAYKSTWHLKQIKVNVESALNEWVTVRSVGLVPSELPCVHDQDDIVLRKTPGLYPDPLYPLEETEGITAFPGQWRSIWISVDLKNAKLSGSYPIDITFESANSEILGREVFTLEVIALELPEQTTYHTEWFHTDCLATYYNVEIFSEAHWRLIEQYVHTAATHGVNMILTPLFTPPLDTEVGGERPTVQLVDVEAVGDTYHFSFEKLERWITLCREQGIKYFEFSHLFTQWGAKHAPKIMVNDQGELKRRFGWETDAAGEDYHQFLHQFLPKLVAFIDEHQLERNSFFHISDEPNGEDLPCYQRASEIIYQHLADFPIMDALSDYRFYEKGFVKNPIPANDHIIPFLEKGVENLWTYYCNGQKNKVSNRFFAMPSFRTRILGLQLYKFNVIGFLHWGYNFWYSQYSKKPIDPFKNTDANYSFPSGDAFLVYPGEHGPIESIRLEVLNDAFQDIRALQLLESYTGRQRVIEILEEGLEHELTFTDYPLELDWHLLKRERINRELKRYQHM